MEREGESRLDNNSNIPPEFRLKQNESYKDVFASKNVEARPMWTQGCRMCPRWWIIGKCYKDCRNVGSHVKSSDLPADKKSAFIEYLEICRRE